MKQKIIPQKDKIGCYVNIKGLVPYRCTPSFYQMHLEVMTFQKKGLPKMFQIIGVNEDKYIISPRMINETFEITVNPKDIVW